MVLYHCCGPGFMMGHWPSGMAVENYSYLGIIYQFPFGVLSFFGVTSEELLFSLSKVHVFELKFYFFIIIIIILKT